MKLILIRGLPGSGKSTLAKEWVKQGYRHFEADMFFDGRDGYQYNPEKIGVAHGWCQLATRFALQDGDSVVVSNTFVRLWEMKAYEIIAKEFGIELEILEAKGAWQNIHGVPSAVIERMKANWDPLP